MKPRKPSDEDKLDRILWRVFCTCIMLAYLGQIVAAVAQLMKLLTS